MARLERFTRTEAELMADQQFDDKVAVTTNLKP